MRQYIQYLPEISIKDGKRESFRWWRIRDIHLAVSSQQNERKLRKLREPFRHLVRGLPQWALVSRLPSTLAFVLEGTFYFAISYGRDAGYAKGRGRRGKRNGNRKTQRQKLHRESSWECKWRETDLRSGDKNSDYFWGQLTYQEHSLDQIERERRGRERRRVTAINIYYLFKFNDVLTSVWIKVLIFQRVQFSMEISSSFI